MEQVAPAALEVTRDCDFYGFNTKKERPTLVPSRIRLTWSGVLADSVWVTIEIGWRGLESKGSLKCDSPDRQVETVKNLRYIVFINMTAAPPIECRW